MSPRELECLEWSSRGNSAGDIGIILGITERTVCFHLNNARAKLGVGSLRQAVVPLTEVKFRTLSCCRFDGHRVKLIPPCARTQQG
ncbi:helix-turn-helix domain-containing protein [Bradyrhizobium sp. CW1]|uniref:helix-turn-helix domain-containing protein n=1 Tax=Bradyrhizobium sp. CW1 TaxID=2782686 RepID=UPI00320824EB